MDLYSDKVRLIDLYRQTITIVNQGFYNNPHGITVCLGDDREMRENSRMYSREFTVNDLPRKCVATEIAVVNQDSIDAGLKLKGLGLNPVVLNFASRTNAGGGVINGSRAQEETIFRRTNMFRSLYQFMPFAEQFGVHRNPRQYPMDRNFGGVYTPYATVFRDSEYHLLDCPERISFVSVAAIRDPQTDGNRLTDDMITGTLNKMRTILRIGLIHGHDAIVLGAFGCGAFHNPPHHIAELFKEVINEIEFRGKYKKIVFAVLEDHNSYGSLNPDGNLHAFMNVFSK